MAKNKAYKRSHIRDRKRQITKKVVKKPASPVGIDRDKLKAIEAYHR